MQTSRMLTLSLLATLALGALPTRSDAQTQTTTIRGSAKDEAKAPFTDFTVQARGIEGGRMSNSVGLDRDGTFELRGLPVSKYMLELMNRQGRVVCTEGPVEVNTTEPTLNVDINCRRVPTKALLLGALAAGGAVAGVTVGAPAGLPVTTPPPSTFAAPPASASR